MDLARKVRQFDEVVEQWLTVSRTARLRRQVLRRLRKAKVDSQNKGN